MDNKYQYQMTSLTPEQQCQRTKNIRRIRKSIELISHQIQEKLKNQELAKHRKYLVEIDTLKYRPIDIDTLCSAFVSYIDNFADIYAQVYYKNWGQPHTYYKIKFNSNSEKIKEDDRKFPYDSYDLESDFMINIVEKLKTPPRKIYGNGDCRYIILNSLGLNGNQHLIDIFRHRYQNLDCLLFNDDDDAPLPSKVNDGQVPGLR